MLFLPENSKLVPCCSAPQFESTKNTELDIFALGGCGIALDYFPTEKNILKNLGGGGKKFN